MSIRNITSSQIIVKYGLEQGLSMADLLKGSQITPRQLQNDQLMIEDKHELRILSNLSLLVDDPFRTGIELGSRYHLASYGIMGYALLSSGTMRKALEVGLRYLSLSYAFTDIFLMNQGGDVGLGFHCDIPGPLGELILTRDMWAVGVIQRELCDASDLGPLQLRFKCAQPDSLTLLEIKKTLHGEVLFDAEENAYVGLGGILDVPLIKANEMAATICEQQCSQLLQEKQNWKPVAKQVQDTIIHLGLQAPMEDVAHYMARTTRTLHRQLKKEGISWRQVRDDVRMGLAEALLLKPMQLSEIAERLGFSDGANFCHSFKRCKGVTPSQYRNTHKRLAKH